MGLFGFSGRRLALLNLADFVQAGALDCGQEFFVVECFDLNQKLGHIFKNVQIVEQGLFRYLILVVDEARNFAVDVLCHGLGKTRTFGSSPISNVLLAGQAPRESPENLDFLVSNQSGILPEIVGKCETSP